MRRRQQVRLQIAPMLQLPEECAPACVAMVLRYFQKSLPVNAIIKSTPRDSPKWRDWLYWLGIVVVRQGLRAEVVTLSTQTFDVSWRKLNQPELRQKIAKEYAFVDRVLNRRHAAYSLYFLEHHPRIECVELRAALSFLDSGGVIRIAPTTADIIEDALRRGAPVIASVDATILYRACRGLKRADDVHGSTWGHVVIIAGFTERSFLIVDPASSSLRGHRFAVSKVYCIESILRRDQNILIVSKKTPRRFPGSGQ